MQIEQLEELKAQLGRNTYGAHLAKAMHEGGVVVIDGKPKYLTPAPPWVFHCMARGVHVVLGAWCITASKQAEGRLAALQAV